MTQQRVTIGLIERVTLEDGNSYDAKIDTGADSSSIDQELAAQLGDKEVVSHKYIKSALGRHKRPLISIDLTIKGMNCNDLFTVSNRSDLKYKILIGKDILQKERFIVDPLMDLIDEEDK